MQKQMLKENNLKLLGLTFIFLFLLGLTFVSGVTGIITNTSLNNSRINTSTYLIYANITECAADCYIGNVSFYIIDYNGTSILIGTNNNNTANDSVFSLSFDSTTWDDRNNVTLNLTATNYTGGGPVNASNWTANLDIDNGFPTVTLATDNFADSANVRGSSTFIVSADADNSIGVNSCLVYFTNTRTSAIDNSSSITPSSNACSNTFTTSSVTGLDMGDTYNVALEYTDGNGNKTNSSTRALVTRAVQGDVIDDAVQTSSSISSKVGGVFSRIGNTISNFFGAIIDFFKNIFGGN